MHPIRFPGRVASPSKIACIGRNYSAHIEELGNARPDDMVVFFKPASCVTDVLLAARGEPVHFEAELCFGVRDGRFAFVGAGLDLTKRGLQNRLIEKALPWERSKAFDGAALFTEFVALEERDCGDLRVELCVDGVRRQFGGCADMIYGPEKIREGIAAFSPWSDDDIVMTGTPAGVGPLQAGAEYRLRALCGDEVLTESSWRCR